MVDIQSLLRLLAEQVVNADCVENVGVRVAP